MNKKLVLGLGLVVVTAVSAAIIIKKKNRKEEQEVTESNDQNGSTIYEDDTDDTYDIENYILVDLINSVEDCNTRAMLANEYIEASTDLYNRMLAGEYFMKKVKATPELIALKEKIEDIINNQ